MPTEGEFLRAAALLDEAAAATRALMDPVASAMGPDVFSGGRLTASVKAAIDRGEGDSRALAGEMNDLAGECQSRARAVAAAAAEAAAYRAAVARHQTDAAAYQADLAANDADPSLPHPGNAPRAPKPPATPPPWAEF